MKKWICIILCFVMLFSISSCSLLKKVVDDPNQEDQEEEEEEEEETKKTEKTEKTTAATTAETTKASAVETGAPNKEIQDLMAVASEEFEKVESYNGSVTMLLDTDITMDATGAQNMVVDMSINYEYYKPTNYMHADVQMKMAQGTAVIEMPMSFYIINDNGTKMYTFAENVWTDTSGQVEQYSDMVGNDNTTAILEIVSAASYGLEMKEDTEQFNGQDVYTITGELTGDTLRMLFENSSTASASTSMDFSKMDFNNYHVPIVMKVYKESNLLAYFSYDLIDLLEDVFADSLSASGISNATISAKKYEAAVSFSDYNSISNPSIPAEVLAAVS